jgi:hypothetical protein
MMRLDRGLRSAALKPYPAGYEAPSTDDVNHETPNCAFGGLSDPGVWVGDDDAPAIVGLNVRVIPFWAENLTASAKLDESLACPIYPPQSVLGKVRIEATREGFYQYSSGAEKMPFIEGRFLDYELELPLPHLYQKDYLIQPQGMHIHWNSQVKPNEDVPYLWAFGAQQIGDDIHPILFSLEIVREQTHIISNSLLFWQERGVTPTLIGQNQDSMIQDIFEIDQTRTLKESLEAGQSVIKLKIGKDETGYVSSVSYISYRLENNVILYMKGG